MAEVREILWRQVTDADFVCVERPKGLEKGGGQTYFSLSFGAHLDKEEFGLFLGVDPPSAIDTDRPSVSIDAGILTEASAGETTIEFKPRYQTGPDDRYRIANQNRQRVRQDRHPAWSAARGFPAAPDDVADKADPRMPDLSFLKLIIVRTDDDRYLADYVNADRLPDGAPGALETLFVPNADAPPDGLIRPGPPGLSVEALRAVVQASHDRPRDGRPTSPEIEDARDATARSAGARSRTGQGYRQSAEERTAIDSYAMRRATDELEASGWAVEDRSINHPYDLFCSRNDEKLHVEVKGTTSEGSAVLLTPNEVEHARAAFPEMALLIVHGISLVLDDEGDPLAEGGEIKMLNPWDIDADGTTRPTGYSYELS